MYESYPIAIQPPAERLRMLRAQGCRRGLEQGHVPGCSLTELALSWDFYYLSHMTRTFRAQFGLTPSNVLLQAAERFRGD